MTEGGERVLEAAMMLLPRERAEVAARLVASVQSYGHAENAWAEVIDARARRQVVGDLLQGAPSRLRTLRFDPEAEADVERAATRYGEEPGRVEAFLGALSSAIGEITERPTAFGELSSLPHRRNLRRIYLRGLPHALVYLVVPTEVRILALTHEYLPPTIDAEISMESLVAVEDWLIEHSAKTVTTLSVATALWA
jgi:hypothetical protein